MGLPPEAAMALAMQGGGAPPMEAGPAGLPPGMGGDGMPSESDVLAMMAEQVFSGLASQQAQISGVEDLLMDALMQAAAALATPDPRMLAPMEGLPAGAGPMPVPAGGPEMTEADMLAGMV